MRLGALISVSFAALWLASCGGGGGSSTTAPVTAPPPPTPPTTQSLYGVPAAESLSVSDVEQIIAQAAHEATARGLPSVIAVTDRVGNVLAVFRMNGTSAVTRVQDGPAFDGTTGPNNGNVGLQGVELPHEFTAISKAITGAYLSSSGNAFSTRTASMIVQEHFPPSANARGLEGGPLFGVQFSQLPCSDFATRYVNAGDTIGPKRSPLGLAADPGGFPLYKNGVVVGGIGVSGDSTYGFDPEVEDIDTSDEELIAIAGMSGFAAPLSIRADRISVDGTTLRFTDKDESDLLSSPSTAPAFPTIIGTAGSLSSVNGYTPPSGAVQAGQAYSTEASGMRPSRASEYANPDVFVMTDGTGANRYPPRAGTDAASNTNPLTQAEVTTILNAAFEVMSRSRAQIRRPLGSRAQVSISIVDTHGQILGIVRSPDAPMFGTDVSLQKARTATFFSNSIAASDLLNTRRSAVIAGSSVLNPEVNDLVPAVRSFLNDPSALTGTKAFADRSGGNLSRPYFPDGEVGTPHGPLSRSIIEWSPFATGLQEDLIRDNIFEHANFVLTGAPPASDTAQRCTFLPDNAGTVGQNRLQNGIQIFPGSVPIYRGTQLVGGIGVSGDGIDQDDMISFLGVHNAGLTLGTLGNAPVDIRADTITVPVNGEPIRLRYVSCPFAPFLDTNEQNPCADK